MSRSHSDNIPETSAETRPTGCKGGLFRANLKAHLDGEMSAARNWLVRWHLAQCAECREELRWLRRLGEDMKDIESARPRPELRARIMANLPSTPPAPGIRVVHSRPDRERSLRLAPRLAMAGGLAMVLAFSTVFAMNHFARHTADGTVAAIGARPGKTPAPVVAPGSGTSSNQEATVDARVKQLVGESQEDPNNALADRMFHEEMAGWERGKRLESQDDWHRLLTQARAVARKTNAPANTEMGITLAVSDVAGVRAHLPGWAKQEGATLVADRQSAPEPAAGTPSPSAHPQSSSEGMVAFYVPAERGPAFLGALKHLGQISLLPSGAKSAMADNLKSETGVATATKIDKKMRAIPAFPLEADGPNQSTEKVVAAREKPVKAIRYLVLSVLLQPITHN